MHYNASCISNNDSDSGMNLLKQKKIDAIRQKNMIQGSFRSDLKVISVCLHY